MTNNNFLLNLGLTKRAGKIIFGYDDVEKHIEIGDARTVFVTSDASESTRLRVKRMCALYGKAPLVVHYTMFDIGNATGRKPTAVFAVTDKGLNSLLCKSLETNGGTPNGKI